MFDFMMYARKKPVKTDQVKYFGDFAEKTWNYFSRLSNDSQGLRLFLISIQILVL